MPDYRDVFPTEDDRVYRETGPNFWVVEIMASAVLNHIVDSPYIPENMQEIFSLNTKRLWYVDIERNAATDVVTRNQANVGYWVTGSGWFGDELDSCGGSTYDKWMANGPPSAIGGEFLKSGLFGYDGSTAYISLAVNTSQYAECSRSMYSGDPSWCGSHFPEDTCSGFQPPYAWRHHTHGERSYCNSPLATYECTYIHDEFETPETIEFTQSRLSIPRGWFTKSALGLLRPFEVSGRATTTFVQTGVLRVQQEHVALRFAPINVQLENKPLHPWNLSGKTLLSSPPLTANGDANDADNFVNVAVCGVDPDLQIDTIRFTAKRVGMDGHFGTQQHSFSDDETRQPWGRSRRGTPRRSKPRS